MLSITELEEDCDRLDKVIDNLDQFLRLRLGNQQLQGISFSPKSKKLAKGFRSIQRHASNLYTALAKCWPSACHQQHEAKMLLEDRLAEVGRPNAMRQAKDEPAHVFHLIFTGGATVPYSLWEEKVVKAFEMHGDWVEPESSTNEQRPRVTVTLGDPAPTCKSPSWTWIKDLCSEIQASKANQEPNVFALTGDCRMAIISSPIVNHPVEVAKETISLTALFSSGKRASRGEPGLGFKVKTSLFLKVACSFLQLSCTPWIAPRLSAQAIAFLQDTNMEIDTTKPYISLLFGMPAAEQESKSYESYTISDALLELGIAFLEIWYEQTLETQFQLQADSRLRQRQECALEWHDQLCKTGPGLFSEAVFFCIKGSRGARTEQLEWGDMALWETVCSKVIEPLHTLSTF